MKLKCYKSCLTRWYIVFFILSAGFATSCIITAVKMPGQRTKFSSAWLSTKDSNGDFVSDWCEKGKDDYHGYCKVCKIDLKCDNGGKLQLLAHCSYKKHKEGMKLTKDKKQAKLTFSANKPGTTSSAKGITSFLTVTNDACMEAEILWLTKMACCNFSLRSADHIGDLFRAMFPDSQIAKDFTMSRTKASYVIGEALGPHFTETIISDLIESGLPFSVHFDETTTSQIKKQMDVALRFWSAKHDEVWTVFYTSLFFGHAEGQKVAEKLYNKMVEDGLPVEKLATLIRDGPNVNKTIFRSVNHLIKQSNVNFPGLVDLGTCVLHTVHNAFNKGMEQFGKEVDQLCFDLHTLFKSSAARREDFRQVQADMEVAMNNFQQHTIVRWLSIGPAIKRILQQWDAICHFVSELAADSKKVPKSVNFRRINSMLGAGEKARTKVLLEFFSACTPVFEQFLLLFQKSTPVTHLLYDSICDLLKRIMRRFMKSEALENVEGSSLAELNCKDASLQLEDKDVVIGDSTKKALKELTAEQQRQMMLGIRSFFQSAAKHLQKKLPLNNRVLRQLGCLNPTKRKEDSTVTSIEGLATVLLPSISAAEVVDEWKLLQVDNELPTYDPKERIEVFWKDVFKLKSITGEERYKLLPVVVKSALILAQTNADSERSLSANARIVTQERALLGESTIVGLHSLREAVRFCDPEHLRPELLEITPALKRAVKKAHASYKDRLQKEKELEKKKKEEQNQKEAEKKRTEEKNRSLMKKKELLAKSEGDLKDQEGNSPKKRT